MKNIIIIGLIFFSKIAFSQEIPSFELTKDGVNPIVVTINNLTTTTLQAKTLNWIQNYYIIEQPESYSKGLIKADVLNGKIRIAAVKKHAWSNQAGGITNYYDVEYFLYVDCQNKKITMSIDFGNTWSQGIGETQSTVVNYKKLWKENGEVHKIFQETKLGIDQMMNELSNSLVNYLREDNNKSDLSQLGNKFKAKVIY